MKKIHPKLHFRRFEAKYVLSKDKAAALKKMILPFLKPDPFAGAGSEYEVRSVYYDSPRFYYYHQKLDGVDIRKKIRARTYRSAEGQFADFVFMEMKRKFGMIIAKDRFTLSVADYEKFENTLDVEDMFGTIGTNNQAANPAAAEFAYEMRVRGLSPKILITYIREPFQGLFDKDLRVTFDRNIRAVENDNLFYVGRDFTEITPTELPGFRSDDSVVVEFKFCRGLPFYIAEAIRIFNLQRTSCSKYCISIDACGTLLKLKPVQASPSSVALPDLID